MTVMNTRRKPSVGTARPLLLSSPGSPSAHPTPALVARAQGGLTFGPAGGWAECRFLNSWRSKRTEICIELISYLPKPLLPAPTVSAGESKVSGGASKVRRRVGLASQFTNSSLEAQNGLSIFGGLLEASVLCRHGGATGFLLRGYSPCLFLRDDYRI
jgi:hypothetical protein